MMGAGDGGGKRIGSLLSSLLLFTRLQLVVGLPRATGDWEGMMTKTLARALLTSVLVLGCGAMAGKAEDAPKGNKGFTASKTTVVELGPEIEGMAGRQLRMRLLTIEPGGYIGIHSHKDRPAVVYDIQGSDEVGLADGNKKMMHPGDTSATPGSTTHYHRNVGNDNVVLIAVDVFHPQKK